MAAPAHTPFVAGLHRGAVFSASRAEAWRHARLFWSAFCSAPHECPPDAASQFLSLAALFPSAARVAREQRQRQREQQAWPAWGELYRSLPVLWPPVKSRI